MYRNLIATTFFALSVFAYPANADDKKSVEKTDEEQAAEYKKKAALEKSLRAVREEYFSAFYRGDTATMAKIEADDFDVFHERQDNRQDAAEWRKGIDKLVQAKLWAPKRLVGETVNMTMRVQMGGKWNWAVVVGAGLVENSDPKAKKEYKMFSETWDMKNGTWRLAHLHFAVGPAEDEK